MKRKPNVGTLKGPSALGETRKNIMSSWTGAPPIQRPEVPGMSAQRHSRLQVARGQKTKVGKCGKEMPAWHQGQSVLGHFPELTCNCLPAMFWLDILQETKTRRGQWKTLLFRNTRLCELGCAEGAAHEPLGHDPPAVRIVPEGQPVLRGHVLDEISGRLVWVEELKQSAAIQGQLRTTFRVKYHLLEHLLVLLHCSNLSMLNGVQQRSNGKSGQFRVLGERSERLPEGDHTCGSHPPHFAEIPQRSTTKALQYEILDVLRHRLDHEIEPSCDADTFVGSVSMLPKSQAEEGRAASAPQMLLPSCHLPAEDLDAAQLRDPRSCRIVKAEPPQHLADGGFGTFTSRHAHDHPYGIHLAETVSVVVIQAMVHVEVQVCACSLLSRLACNGHNRHCLREVDAIGVVMGMSGCEGTEATVCEVLWRLCFDDAARSRITELGGIEVLCREMTRREVHLRRAGCAALFSLGLGKHAHRTNERIRVAGGFNLVIEAMSEHVQDLVLQRFGYGALRNLSKVGRVTAAGVVALWEALTAFPKDTELARFA